MSGPRRGRAARVAQAVSAWVYRLLVRIRYPAPLRARFGLEMEALFGTLLEEELEGRGTVRGLAAAWGRVVRDLARPVGASAPTSRGRLAHRQGVNRQGQGGDRQSGKRRGVTWSADMREDAAYALRTMARDPRFAALVVLVPAIGIALTVAVFGVVNAYLLRPLPYPAPDRLVSVGGAAAAGLSWDELDGVFERAVSWDLDVFSMVGDGEPELVSGAWVTPTFLEVYGVRPALGRAFLPEEGRPGSAPVALISHRLWRDRFGGDPTILGRSFSAYMSDRPDAPESFTVVGVLPADFWYFNAYTDVLAPIVEPRTIYTGRLREGLPLARAAELLTALAHRRNGDLPADARIELTYLHERHVAAVRPTLLVLQAAVLLVLLIACANTAVLLLVRAAARERELGVRRALGAPSGRLARQLVTEGIVLAGLAGIVGLVLAVLGVDGLARVAEERLGRSVPGGPGALRVDATVVAAAAALSAAIGVLFGLVPLATSARGPLAAVLGEMARGGTDSRGRRRMRDVMVSAEVALSLSLLIGAGLMVRSAVHLQDEDLGFDPERVVRGQVGIRQAAYADDGATIAFFDRLIDGVRALPEVESAALVSAVPFTTRFGTTPVGTQPAAGGAPRRSEAVGYVAGEGWFGLMGIAITAGRDFSRADVAGGEPAAIVSDALANRLWPGDNAVGRYVRTLPRLDGGMMAEEPGPWLRVIGVVADARREVGGPPPGDLYTSLRQSGRFWMHVVARARAGADTERVLPAVEDVLHRIDPVVPLSAPLALEAAVSDATAPTRFLAILLAGFSAVAVLLAVMGLYGVIAYAARQRRRDVAIRMALGADRAEVAGLFLRQGMAVVLAGVALGTAGGYALGRALAGQLHGVSPGDPLTHAALAGLLFVTAGAAVWLPARRASAAEPMRVLREE